MMLLAKNVALEEGFKNNQNVLVLGVPGSGKSRGHVLPNLMEMTSSFVVLDPKGELFAISAKMLKSRGYKVQCVDFDTPLNTVDYYNPLQFIETEDDILRVTDLLVADLKRHSTDMFWGHSAQILANSLVGYLMEECNPEERTLTSVLKLLKCMPANENCPSTLDIMFETLKRAKPNCFAIEQYELVKTCSASEKTLASIIISLVATFSGLMTEGIKHLTGRNTIDFRRLGHEKTALFIKSSDNDRSKDILVNLLFRQAMDELYREADYLPNHCLPLHVHFFLDDFGTNLVIDHFDATIAGMRSREMSCSVILQSEGQLRQMYGEAWSTILGSCAAYVFLGSNDINTCRDVSFRINKPLEEVLYKKSSDIYVFIQGRFPVRAERYDLRQHIFYGYLEDFDIKSRDVELIR